MRGSINTEPVETIVLHEPLCPMLLLLLDDWVAVVDVIPDQEFIAAIEII